MNALALSDLVLALSCAVALSTLARAPLFRAGMPAMTAGWLLLAAAAALGALRFGPMPAIEPAHRLLSELAAAFGLPAVAIGLYWSLRRPLAPPASGLYLLTGMMAVQAVASVLGHARASAAVLALLAATLIAAAPGLGPAVRAAAAAALGALLAAAGFAGEGRASAAALTGLHGALAFAQLAWLWVWTQAARPVRHA